MLDHRGNGRSDHGDPALWTLAQWGDDVRAFCEALRIERPIVLGYSFGGLVAQSYAIRHPDHPAKLVLYSTAPVVEDGPVLDAFEAIGGKEARAVAERYCAGRTDATTAESAASLPAVSPASEDPAWMQRSASNLAVFIQLFEG